MCVPAWILYPAAPPSPGARNFFHAHLPGKFRRNFFENPPGVAFGGAPGFSMDFLRKLPGSGVKDIPCHLGGGLLDTTKPPTGTHIASPHPTISTHCAQKHVLGKSPGLPSGSGVNNWYTSGVTSGLQVGHNPHITHSIPGKSVLRGTAFGRPP